MREAARRPRNLVMWVLFLATGAALVSWRALNLSIVDFLPSARYASLFVEFFARAASPAFSYESRVVGIELTPLPLKALAAALFTLRFAAFALTLALLIGAPLGILSSRWMLGSDPSRNTRAFGRLLLYGTARLTSALLRSLHELVWAVLFLAAFGISDVTAALAIALPYGGVFAKVFSELLDEAPTGPIEALHRTGAGTMQSFLFAAVPLASADLTAYLLYRFECAVRSSTVLGFFGVPTLGYYIAASFENLHYGEVWTYLYVLIGLVVALDIMGNFLRGERSGAGIRTWDCSALADPSS